VNFALVLSVAQAQTRYSAVDLGNWGGACIAYGINDEGQIVGWANTNGSNNAFLYSSGTMIDLGTLGGYESHAFGINDYGQVVGYSYTNGAVLDAFLYSGGTMSDLGSIVGSDSMAYGINDHGQIAGGTGNPNHAFLFSGGMSMDLGTLGGLFSWAYGINDRGQVAGYADTGNEELHAFLYSGGTMYDLGTPGSTSQALALNSNGQVVGWFTTNNTTHAFLYKGEAMIDLGTLGGAYSEAFGINSNDQVVGYSYATGYALPHAFLYNDGTMYDLNTLVTNSIGREFTFARGINDSGEIIAQDSANQAWMLIPLESVPEPSPAILVLLCAPVFVYRCSLTLRRRTS
jgi:probable HAF family extracellular repeat protein